MNNKKYGKIAILLLIGAVLIGTVGIIVADKIHHNNEMSTLQEVAYGSSSLAEATAENTEVLVEEANDSHTDSTSEASTNASTENETTEVELFADIDALQDVNPDIFAWIKVPGTKIDYPVVQHPTDDEFYLKHGADGMNSSYGCPFIESCDSKNLDDFNTVIYGHNMNDGSMFAGLHQFEDQEFYDNHRWVEICTSEHVFSFEIFAAVLYSDNYIPYCYDDAVMSDREAFIDSLKTDIVAEKSIYSNDIKVNEQDKIVTLSTCDRVYRDNRFVVAGVLRKIDGQDV